MPLQQAIDSLWFCRPLGVTFGVCSWETRYPNPYRVNGSSQLSRPSRSALSQNLQRKRQTCVGKKTAKSLHGKGVHQECMQDPCSSVAHHSKHLPDWFQELQANKLIEFASIILRSTLCRKLPSRPTVPPEVFRRTCVLLVEEFIHRIFDQVFIHLCILGAHSFKDILRKTKAA